MDFVERKTADLAEIETTYLTRAWAVRRTWKIHGIEFA